MVRRFAVALVIAVVLSTVFAKEASAFYMECFWDWVCWPFL